jgi:hypothetical protein
MPKIYKAGEQHEQLVSEAYAKYRDMRMPWVGQYEQPHVYTVTDVSGLVAPVNERRVWCSLQNDGSNKINLSFGTAATASSGMVLGPNGSLMLDGNNPWPNNIFAICAAGLTSTLLVTDVSQETESGRGE